jgi:ribonuclease HI
MPDFVITVDGGSLNHGTPDAAGYGSAILQITATDFTSKQMRFEFGLGVTNNEAEYRAVIEAVKFLTDIIEAPGSKPEKHSLLIRTDSALVIGHMSQGWKLKAKNLTPYYDELKPMLRRFKDVRFEKMKGTEIKTILGH